MENPANGIKDAMWHFLMDGGQKEDIPELKDAVYRLIQMTTQKTAGQAQYAKATHISWETLDMEIMRIVIEATCLVLSGRLDELEDSHKGVVRGGKEEGPDQQGEEGAGGVQETDAGGGRPAAGQAQAEPEAVH